MRIIIDTLNEVIINNERHFDLFANKRYSFEDWLNMEMCIALNHKVGCNNIENTPKYSDNNARLDIAFTYENKSYGVELKIAHPGTQEKYKHSCKYDLEKLKSDDSFDKKYFILVIATGLSTTKFNEDRSWDTWITEILDKSVAAYIPIDNKNGSGSVHIYIQKVTTENNTEHFHFT